MRFQTKLMLGITALSFGTTAFFSVLFLNLARGLAAERLEEKALSLARNLASNSSQAVYNEDLYKQLGPLLKGLLETPDVVAACVRDASGRVLARAGADLPAAAEAGWSEGARGRVFTAAAPVRSRGAGLTPNDSSIGSVRVVLSLEMLAARIRRMLVLIGGFVALILVAGLILAFFLARRLTRPFIRILEADEAVVRGDLEHSDILPADIPADEIGTIMRSRSAMLSSLRRSESESRLFLSGVEQSDDGIFMTGVDGKILFVNAGFERMTGFSRREAVGAAPKILKSGAHDADFYRAFLEDPRERGVLVGDDEEQTQGRDPIRRGADDLPAEGLRGPDHGLCVRHAGHHPVAQTRSGSAAVPEDGVRGPLGRRRGP